MNSRVVAVGLALAVLLARVSVAGAQTFPNRPITVLVPSGPGGVDTMVRLIGPEVGKDLGQPLIIENRPGANGLIGMRGLMRAEPDGYTLIFATISIMAINPFIYKNIPYNSVDDFKPVSRYAIFPFVFAANPKMGFKSMGDLIAYGKQHPDALKFGNPGNGSAGYLLQEAFLRKHGIKALLVPFSSAPQANMGAMQGTVDVTVDNASSLAGFISDGTLPPLAVTTDKRSASIPNVPSWLEDGSGPFAASAWYLFLAPKGTPDEVVNKLNVSFNRALADPTVQQRLKDLGGTFEPLSPAETRSFIASELEKYGNVVKEIGLTPE
jgi:tripartite-type tricarboxylate transporter receptor subunit TctC